MSKLCPKCSSELPEESSFCLNCFSYIGENRQAQTVAEASKKEKIRQKNHINNKAVNIAGAVLATLAILTVSASFINGATVNKNDIGETTLVPVTEPSGEPVTDENGEEQGHAVSRYGRLRSTRAVRHFSIDACDGYLCFGRYVQRAFNR